MSARHPLPEPPDSIVGEVVEVEFDSADYSEGALIKILVPESTVVGHWYVRIERLGDYADGVPE